MAINEKTKNIPTKMSLRRACLSSHSTGNPSKTSSQSKGADCIIYKARALKRLHPSLSGVSAVYTFAYLKVQNQNFSNVPLNHTSYPIRDHRPKREQTDFKKQVLPEHWLKTNLLNQYVEAAEKDKGCPMLFH